MSSAKDRGSRQLLKKFFTNVKCFLSFWSDVKGLAQVELLNKNQKMTKDIYCEKLRRLKLVLEDKRPSSVSRRNAFLHHHNARPHAATG
ncbi:hypothetical protein AVEN_32541-1 [Araneus ventricosus]|uniref:Transposase n=1 Tax=Araneus ventricosus TaxID=182803 RepID=A0A4Y2JK35_ARAVE|nr:hypothetical protein AVEN_32541-1 [Araneus ventricosus]